MTEFDLRRRDCVEGMSRLPNEHVDLAVTSPPYNLGVRYRKFFDQQDRQSYLRWCRKWAAEVRTILKWSGSFFLTSGSPTRGSDLRCRGNTWFIPYETIQRRARQRRHPATFPVQLAEWCIKLHGLSCVHTMLDPFLGIGNSAIAAQRCGVKKFIGFEIDETYLAEAKRRVSKIL